MRLFKYTATIVALWFVAHTSFICWDGLSSKPKKSEFAIIYGNKVNEDGSLSNRLKARLDHGLELYLKGDVNSIFVSGGIGVENQNEASTMANYLIEKGVKPNAIFVDSNGNNSWLTAQNFHKSFPKVTSVIAVSQYHHISRAKLSLRKIGISNVYGSAPFYFETRDLYAFIREFAGYYKYLITY